MPTNDVPESAPAANDPATRRASVVVGVDCSPQSQHVLRKAATIAQQLDADLEAVFVYVKSLESGWVVPLVMPDRELATLMHKTLSDTVDTTFGAHHPPRLSQWAVAGDPATTLLARAVGASVLVVGSNGGGELANLILGSVAAKCVEHADGPVFVISAEPKKHPDRGGAVDDQSDGAASASAGRVVVGVDGSAASKEALRWAVKLAALNGTGVDAVITCDPPVYFSGVGLPYLPVAWNPREDNMRYLEQTVDDVFRDHRPTNLRLYAEEGSAGRRLLAHATNAQLLVVGSRGHGGFHNLLLGSVSSKCANRSSCPVLVVHVAPDPAASGDPADNGVARPELALNV
jgi:nucleotide-binding universal stress UspA family protein